MSPEPRSAGSAPRPAAAAGPIVAPREPGAAASDPLAADSEPSAADRSALRRVHDWIEDAVVGATMGFLMLLPVSWGCAALRQLGNLAYLVGGARRRRAIHLVQDRLGAEAARARWIVRRCYQGLALNMLELHYFMRRLRGRDPDELVEVEGVEHLQRVLASGRAVLLCGAHIGAWELVPFVVQRVARPMWIVAKASSNPRLERRVQALRPHARGFIDHHDARRMAELVRAGELVGILLDQRARRYGVRLPFLGRPASQHRVAGILARRFGALCVPAYCVRQQVGRPYRIVFEAPVTADPALPRAAAEIDVVARLSRSLEVHVRRHPEQWLWMHDRWRRAELGRAADVAELEARDAERSEGGWSA